MDKKLFCDEMAIKLRELDRYFQLQSSRPASTAEKTMQQDQRRPRLDEGRMRVEALSGQLDSVCAGAAPLTDAVREDIEQKLTRIKELLR